MLRPYPSITLEPLTLEPLPEHDPIRWPPAPPGRDDLENPLRRLRPGLPLDGRARVQQQPSHRREIPPLPPLARSLRGPDQRLALELPIAHVHGRAVREQD